QFHQAGRNRAAFVRAPGAVVGSRRAVRSPFPQFACRRRGIAHRGRDLRLSISQLQITGVLADVSERGPDSPGCLISRVAGLDRLLPGPERIELGLKSLTGGGKPFLLAS